jgi:deoxyribonuclease V
MITNSNTSRSVAVARVERSETREKLNLGSATLHPGYNIDLQKYLYPPSITEAAIIQRELAQKVIVADQFETIEYIGGMDVSNNPYDPEKIIHATIVVLNKELQVVETSSVSMRQDFPYISGFLGFREAPALLQAWDQLKIKPQLTMVDGHGISHPRGLGIASHIGVLLDIPTIGVAKTILVGKPQEELGLMLGDHVPLIWRDKQIATVLRTKLRCKPLFIAPGHKISMTTAMQLVLQYLRGYRLPEPTRQAHLAANAARKKYKIKED